MQKLKSYNNKIPILFMLLVTVVSVALTSCKGKQKEDEEWVDSVLHACDSIPEDTLVYDVDEQAPSESVDENFNDFIYAFTHNGQFQLERMVLPLKVFSSDHQQLRLIKSTGEFHKDFSPSSKEYYLMLLNDASEMEHISSDKVKQAILHLFDFNNQQVRDFDFDRKDTLWKLRSEQVTSFDDHPLNSFLDFYQRFATDSVYQEAHIAKPLMISMPSDDESGEIVQGTIDPDQFSVFAPEMPKGQVMVLDYNKELHLGKRIVMVKCGMASSMMDVLTFEQDGGVWRLVSLDE